MPPQTHTVLSADRIRDNRTTLEWQANDVAPTDWITALSYCESATIDGLDDWRLPSPKELGSLIDETQLFPALSSEFTVNYEGLWSSTAYRASASNPSWNNISWLDQTNGFTNQGDGLTGTTIYAVRFVRGGGA